MVVGRLRSRHAMRVNARLLRSLANREPGRGHKTENGEEDEEYRECGGHNFYHSTQTSGKAKDHAWTVQNHVFVGIYYQINVLSNLIKLPTAVCDHSWLLRQCNHGLRID